MAGLAEAYGELSRVVGSSRALRAACPRLLRDVLAVLTGLRPAFMLDYALLPAERLAAAAAAVAAALHLGPAAAGCCVAELGGCAYLVCPAALPDLQAQAGGAAGRQADATEQTAVVLAGGTAQLAPLMFVAFDGPRARWATEAEAVDAAGALQAVRRGLLAAVGGSGGGATPAGAAAAAAAAARSLPVIQAEGLPGWQALAPPTASGYLLGYPALYLCHDLEGAQAATHGLSSGSLCLHQAGCALAAAGAAGVPQPDAWEQPLLAFSVPDDLAAAPAWEVCLAAWQAELEARRGAAASALGGRDSWGTLQLRVASQPPRPVAL
ncbi:hypothetical protein C2E20_7598 isoform X2 [Micractinium conductrix]|uniref:Uncharacterized protein n=1 Tax=Micractinium conductrix TaxID=554055 RepID=A0A2P6V423_9CHLO|nr:hypothetical protein C2E20_7598 isoform X2 [Micractinium conductrix]|eukprot:PSC68834.1 hypothetical protein C2E20_7598 isoform X2 [Micractinium conductrix]